MPNANVIARFVGGNTPTQGPNAVPSITLVGTTEQLFKVQSPSGTAILAPFPPGQPLGASTAPSFGAGFDGFPFKVRAAFKVTTGGTSTCVINMYANQVGTTITSGNKVATITSQSLATASASGWLEATLIWDSIGLVLSGGQQGSFGTTVVTGNAALTNTAISIPALSNLNFAMTATNGSSVTGTIVTLTEFCIDTL
jgi:hypothetical protein